MENFKCIECKVLVIIKSACNIQGLSEYQMNSKAEYISYLETSNKFQNMLINKSNLSTFTPQVADILDTYGAQIHVGKIVNDDMCRIDQNNVLGLDGVNFYP
jgi:uncharacterized protein involved in high-affinity Fe2+ transport